MNRKATFKAGMILLCFCLGMPVQARAEGSHVDQKEWHCPWMGHGSMRQHQGNMGCNTMVFEDKLKNTRQPLTRDQAAQMIENYMRYVNNPNLRTGDVSDKGEFFESEIMTKDGSLVEKVQINKNTGSFRNVYR